MSLIDYENNHIYNENLYKLLNYNNRDDFHISSYIFTILNLNQENKILLSYLEENSLDLSIINLSTKDFSSYDIINNTKRYDDLLNFYSFSSLTCLITELKFIECIILYDTENKLIVEIYDKSLNHLDSIFLSNVELIGDSLFVANRIHLKDEIDVFAYYPFSVSNFPCPLYVQINKLVFNGSHFIFESVIENENILNITTSENITVYDHSRDIANMKKESLIKINDNKFAYCYFIDYNNITIVIFDLYGTNKESIFIRYYHINLDLYFFVEIYRAKLFKFNSFLGITFTGSLVENEEIGRGGFFIFGYFSKKQNIDLEMYKNNQGYILELNNYFSIDNNLFGYELEIKISYIPNELSGLRFFSINEEAEIKINDIINPNDKIIFDFYAINFEIKNYIIEITSIISTPKYDNLTQFYDKKDEYGETFQDFYERKIIEEKIYKINLYISCHEQSIKTCNYPELPLTTKTIQSNSINIIYFSNYIFRRETDNLLNAYLYSLNNYNDDNIYCNNIINEINENNYMNECKNECPSFYF